MVSGFLINALINFKFISLGLLKWIWLRAVSLPPVLVIINDLFPTFFTFLSPCHPDRVQPTRHVDLMPPPPFTIACHPHHAADTIDRVLHRAGSFLIFLPRLSSNTFVFRLSISCTPSYCTLPNHWGGVLRTDGVHVLADDPAHFVAQIKVSRYMSEGHLIDGYVCPPASDAMGGDWTDSKSPMRICFCGLKGSGHEGSRRAYDLQPRGIDREVVSICPNRGMRFPVIREEHR